MVKQCVKKYAIFASLAAGQGDSEAQYIVGLLYYFGEGTTKNVSEAKKWLKKAAAQGNKDAKDFLKKL